MNLGIDRRRRAGSQNDQRRFAHSPDGMFEGADDELRTAFEVGGSQRSQRLAHDTIIAVSEQLLEVSTRFARMQLRHDRHQIPHELPPPISQPVEDRLGVGSTQSRKKSNESPADRRILFERQAFDQALHCRHAEAAHEIDERLSLLAVSEDVDDQQMLGRRQGGEPLLDGAQAHRRMLRDILDLAKHPRSLSYPSITHEHHQRVRPALHETIKPI